MTEGALLYVEEFNRVPEETMNVLLGVLSEREMHVPRFGRVAARPTFRQDRSYSAGVTRAVPTSHSSPMTHWLRSMSWVVRFSPSSPGLRADPSTRPQCSTRCRSIF